MLTLAELFELNERTEVPNDVQECFPYSPCKPWSPKPLTCSGTTSRPTDLLMKDQL